MTELKSKQWIVAKGLLFLGLAILCATLILMESPSWKIATLLALLAWSACRFYYFLFYVLERYVDPTLRYAGVFDLLKRLIRPPREH